MDKEETALTPELIEEAKQAALVAFKVLTAKQRPQAKAVPWGRRGVPF
ncbi:hypothetical protein LCGC14_0385920 [marine sediment metagenome]|uniref:Uncharacterized protein n=1 Tax=marine sediment metagenome TaxID=412755 RepID=A0A0F9W9S4_9ZZZZ